MSGAGRDTMGIFTPEIDRLIMGTLLSDEERMLQKLGCLGIQRQGPLARIDHLCRVEEYLDRCLDAGATVAVPR